MIIFRSNFTIHFFLCHFFRYLLYSKQLGTSQNGPFYLIYSLVFQNLIFFMLKIKKKTYLYSRGIRPHIVNIESDRIMETLWYQAVLEKHNIKLWYHETALKNVWAYKICYSIFEYCIFVEIKKMNSSINV